MRKVFMAVLAIASYSCFAQDRIVNDPNAEKRNVSGFHTIRTEDGIDLYLTSGSEENVAVSASSVEYRNRIISKVTNGVLSLSFDAGSIGQVWKNRKLKAYISFKKLQELTAAGGSDIMVHGTLSAPVLFMKLSSGSDFSGAVNVPDLKIEQHSGSDVTISGSAANVIITATGGSDFAGYELITEMASIKATGGSDAELTVNKELVAEASSGSDIEFRGKGILKKSASGSGGSVKKRG